MRAGLVDARGWWVTCDAVTYAQVGIQVNVLGLVVGGLPALCCLLLVG